MTAADGLGSLGHYRLEEKLGQGGMGAVYRAVDTRLHRQVAVKVVTAGWSSSPEARARVLREARTAAAVNHPNLCTIFEIGEVRAGEEEALAGQPPLVPGMPYLVVELVEGSSLAERLEAGPLEVGLLVSVGRQLATGLAAMHGRGIIHRDLKPGNVMITSGGLVKILDFGLAKAERPFPWQEGSAAETSPLLSAAGSVVGTVAYMSPEQAEGRALDARSDIFSLGVVLYEVATGRRPFAGGSAASIIAKILTENPRPLAELRRELPPAVTDAVEICLRKRPEERFSDAGQIELLLAELEQGSSGSVTRPVVGGRGRRAGWWWGAAAVAIAVDRRQRRVQGGLHAPGVLHRPLAGRESRARPLSPRLPRESN